MVRRITEDDPLRVRTHLHQWINEKRHLEIDEGLIQHLKGLPKDKLEKALRELKGKKKFVRVYKGNQISVRLPFRQMQFRVASLVDSGCTKLCIDAGLVERFKVPKKRNCVYPCLCTMQMGPRTSWERSPITSRSG